MCVECGTVLSVSSSPVAQQERAVHPRRRSRPARTRTQIKAALVDEYGEDVLAEPEATASTPRCGSCRSRSSLARRGRHRRSRSGAGAERGADRRAGAAAAAERRGRRAPGRGAEHVTGGVDTTVIAAFAVGFVSFISPCVLPLVPGYLSRGLGPLARRHEVRRAQPGRRSCCPRSSSASSFTAVFVALGMTATGLGSHAAEPARHAGQDRGRGDHRARRLLPADAVRPAPQQGVAAGRADQPRRLRRAADRRRGVRGRVDAVRRPDARLDPQRRRHPGHGRQGRHPARLLLASGSRSRSCSPRSPSPA